MLQSAMDMMFLCYMVHMIQRLGLSFLESLWLKASGQIEHCYGWWEAWACRLHPGPLMRYYPSACMAATDLLYPPLHAERCPWTSLADLHHPRQSPLHCVSPRY